MTTEQDPEVDNLRTAVAALLAAFESLGPEHQALTAEETDTTAKERQGTVRRMLQSITDAGRILVHAMELLALAHGMRALGINHQMAKDSEGHAYSPLLRPGNPGEKLYEAMSYVQVAIVRLGEAYEPTKKYPALAVARQPQAVKTVLASLRTALTSLCAELTIRDPEEDITEFDGALGFLTELETRVCLTLPTQAAFAGLHVSVSTMLLDKLLSAGVAERDVAMWLLAQPDGQWTPDEIDARLGLERGQAEKAVRKLKAIGLLRDDGTLVGVHRGSVPA